MSTLKEDTIIQALLLLIRHCPRLIRQCYWAGTSSIAVEELHHRESLKQARDLLLSWLKGSTS